MITVVVADYTSYPSEDSCIFVYLENISDFILEIDEKSGHYMRSADMSYPDGLRVLPYVEIRKKRLGVVWIYYFKDIIFAWHLLLRDQRQTAFRLTHWGRDKIDVILQTTFSNAISWMKMN